MDISVLISWKTQYDHVAWSLGWCPYCEAVEAVRIEYAMEVISIWFIPVNKSRVGTGIRCDFCENPIEQALTKRGVPLADWSPTDGMAILEKRLLLPEPIQTQDKNADSRLHSLLSATEEASSINNVDITFGLTTGPLVGVALLVPVGIFLFDNKIVPTHLDKFGFIFASVLAGVVGGAIVGAVIQSLFKPAKVAYAKIESACGKYGLDTNKLMDLSRQYGNRVQQAVRAVRDVN